MCRSVPIVCLVSASMAWAQNAEQDVRKLVTAGAEGAYGVEGDAIVMHNGTRYHNRPLYCNHIPAFALAGDRPCVRLARDPYVYGCFMAAYARGNKAVWLHEAADRQSLYRPGRMEWQIADPAFGEAKVVMQAVTVADGSGMALRLIVEQAAEGDQVIVGFGGATRRVNPAQSLSWGLDPRGSAGLLTRGFVPEDCSDNQVRREDERFVLHPPAYAADAKVPMHTVVGACSEPWKLTCADASAFKDPQQLAAAQADKLPMVCGTVALKSGSNEVYWLIRGDVGENAPAEGAKERPKDAFVAGMQRAETVGRQMVVDTPDPRFNAAAAAVCTAMDAVWYPPVFVHGAMLWNTPFPGWRTIYGPTALGWHDRVLEEAKYYTSHQEKTDTKRTAKAEPSVGYGQESGASRFYGKGRIRQDQHFYNFQTQFFDQLVHAWRWTGNAELEKLLRPALELHLQWQQECFDPDDDGLYESYINTWPTDSVWYAGGAGGEETAYAYTGHLAAADLARRAGDETSSNTHRTRAQQIHKAFQKHFWIPEKGYPGAYIEQTGHKRLHTDSWLYSIFLPIDAGLLDNLQSSQALHYTEWGLQRVPSPLGGERCWTSNWVPSTWSTRVLYPGDNYHLALAYFKSGLIEDGWKILRGAAYEAAYNGPVPGCVAVSIGGTDFNDCTSMFARTVVEGVFGYHPDYANDTVRIAPAFPRDWDHASIKTPDFSLQFIRNGGQATWAIELTKPAILTLTVPTPRWLARDNAGPTDFAQSIEQGVDMMLDSHTASEKVQSVRLVTENPAGGSIPEEPIIEATAGKLVELRAPRGNIISIEDPQQVLTESRIEAGLVRAVTAANPGYHLVVASVELDQQLQRHLFKLHVSDPAADRQKAAEAVRDAPQSARWKCVDLKTVFNGDVREIYKQQYLSPRPNTCSVRIGSDGYSPWTFYYWQAKPPEIDLGNVAGMLNAAHQLMTPQAVPFTWSSAADGNAEKNIAFTSTWDNWPRSIRVPVSQSGAAAWFLVCGTTNPMQTRIANGEIRLVYADGSIDKLELIPPMNFWTLCPLREADYDYKTDAFCLPPQPPATVQLGKNCRAMLLSRRLRAGVVLERVELETLSPEVVIGLMGVTVMSE